MRASPPTTAYLLLVLAALCWGGNFVLGRAMHAEIPPIAFNFWRWVVAVAVLAPFAARPAFRHRDLIRANWRVILMLALLGITVFNTLAYTALSLTTAVNAALIMASLPVVITVLSFAIYGERVARRQAVGVGLSLLGVAVIVLRGDASALATLEVAAGDLWMVAGAFVWALYSVLLRERPAALPQLPFMFAMAVTGVVFLAPLYAAEAWMRGPIAVTAETLASLAYVGVFASVIAYMAWNRGVADLGAGKAGHLTHLMPVFAPILGVVLLGQSLHAYHGWAVALIAARLALATARAWRRWV